MTAPARALAAPERLSVEVDALAPDEWDRLVAGFADASYEQTACWTEGRWGPRSSHLVVRRDDVPVAAARAVIVRLPGIRRGLAYVKFGPLWRRRGAPVEPALYRVVVSALVDEYCGRRGHALTVLPRPTPPFAADESRALAELGFTARRRMADPNRYIVDAGVDTDERLRALEPKWRYNLRRALRHGIACDVVDAEVGVAAFRALHAMTMARKRFDEAAAVDLLPTLAARLPEALRPYVVLARHAGRVVAGAVVALAGDTAFYVFGASDASALPLNAGYALQWWIVGWVASRGLRWYDLGGEAGSPGLRQFKKGLVGSRGVVLDGCRELDRALDARARLAGDAIHRLRAAARSARSWRARIR